MSSSSRTTTPLAMPIAEALGQSTALAHLQALIRASNERFAVIRPLLPEPLATQLRAGPIVSEGWTLLASNAAAAAKLRQLLPRLEAALQQQGLESSPIRIRVQSTALR